MSKEDDDDARLFTCFKKYEEIVKQVLLVDDMTESIDPRSRLSKRKSNCRGNSNGGNNGSGLDRESLNQVIVQTITKFLHDLNSTTIDHSSPEPSSDE